MKGVAASLFVALAGSGFAQITTAEKDIQIAFESLRQKGEIMLALDGTDKLGPRIDNLYTSAFFQWDPLNPSSPTTFAKADVMDYLNGARTHRIDADGVTLWGYDFARNAYTNFRYGSYSGPQPANFRANMLQELTKVTRGPTVFLARMFREIFSGDFAQYSTWMPMANITVVSKASGTLTMVDPVSPTRTYIADDVNYYIVYTYSSRPNRSAAFHFTRPDLTTPWALSEIFYADSLSLNASTPRLIDWRITVYADAPFPTSTNYVFIPPSNARAIANIKGQGG